LGYFPGWGQSYAEPFNVKTQHQDLRVAFRRCGNGNVRRRQNYIRALAAFSSVHRDPHTQAPWLFDGQIFWTYEDPVSIRYKVSYAAHQRLAGIMIWELSGDTADAELLRVAHRSLRRPMVIRDVEETAAESLPASSTSPLN